MHNFQYVTARQLSPVKQDLILIINSVQDLAHKDFTFRFDFVGSAERNMVTYDVGTNIGFDFDVNIQVNDNECKFSAKEIKTKIMQSIVVRGQPRLLGLLGREADAVFPWSAVKRFGTDIILVDGAAADSRQRRNR